MTTKLTTGNTVLAYAHLTEPVALMTGTEPKYGCCVLIDKSDKATLEKIKAAIETEKAAAAQTLWGGKVPTTFKSPLRDGDTDRPDAPEFAGKYFMNCSSRFKPGVFDRHLSPITDPGEVYSGMIARVSVNFYPYSVQGNKGIAVGLNGVQKIADGDRMDGANSANDFSEVDDDDDYNF